MRLSEARQLAEGYRRQGLTTVFTNGCFDLLHVGHIASLNEAASKGNRLFVAINSDTGVRRLKGPGRPLIHDRDRAIMLAALSVVAHVLVFDEDTPLEMIKAIRPNVLVKGGSYSTEDSRRSRFRHELRRPGASSHDGPGHFHDADPLRFTAGQEPIRAPIIHSLPSSETPAASPGGAKRVA